MTSDPSPAAWQTGPLGAHLERASQRFQARVLALVANHPQTPLALANLARRAQVGAAQLHISRHLPRGGARLTALAQAAGMTKQAMGHLVTQCEAWGMVKREPDPHDQRARRIVFTDTGLAWLSAFEAATTQAQAEFETQVGRDVATVVLLGLEAYGAEG